MMTTQATQPITEVKTFRARSMREALEVVKDTMGPEAVILHTRQIPGKRLLPWQNAPDEVEITAGIGINVPSYATYKQTPTRRAESTARELPPHLEMASSTGVTVELSQPQPNRTAPPPGPSAPPRPEPSLAELARQIESIQKMLKQLGLKNFLPDESAGEPADNLPVPLKELHHDLLEREIPESIAGELIEQLKSDCTSAQLDDAVAVRAMLSALIERRLSISGPIEVQRGRRKVVALVGAGGVGKTTTIAKLAANFRLRDQVKMGLVTVDTYRIAAVEQLRTYAEIIDLPMKVVTNPLEMRRALDELVGLDLVLIDTAGRSPRDELQIQELKRLLAEARVDEVHLVLSLTSGLRSLLASAEKFVSANASRLILTKLDEATSLGNLLALSREVNLPISYLTTGQDVPNDIEPARADRIARLILGSDTLPI